MKRIVILLAIGPLLLGFAPGRAQTQIVEQPLRFAVQNINRSKVPCLTDGAFYQLAGYLVAPAAALSVSHPAVTVYLHGVMLKGTWLWRVKGYDGAYDFASRMAELGHVAVVIDRIGYGRSGTPNGNRSCLGGQADVVHQVIQHLRNGTYSITGGAPVAFDRVALAGHSYGGLIAPIEAYSFRDVDALLGLASAFDQGLPPDFFANAMEHILPTCLRGGERKHRGGPRGYTFSFGVPDDFYYDIDGALKAEISDRLERDPCGDDSSLVPAIAVDRLKLKTIHIPVLLLAAENDIAFPPKVMKRQGALYSGTSDLTVGVIEKTGHGIMFERALVDEHPAAERLRLALDAWLTPRGF